MRIASLILFLMMATTFNVQALSFPEGCRTPPGVVTEIWDLDGAKATMVGKHTKPDILFACTAGYVHQGAMEADACVKYYDEEEIFEDRLEAQANCPKGAITVNGNLTIFPVQPNCANGGFQAIEAFRTLCPNSGIRLEQ
ncbi:MAG: hypothetical protein NXH99_13165 [Rhodobacteraceae bacterium]|nr:hypothetical protein [Paracoccaceae bacterium]